MSEMEWEDGMQIDGSTSTGTSDSDGGGCTSVTSLSDDQNDYDDRDQENPFCNVPVASVGVYISCLIDFLLMKVK